MACKVHMIIFPEKIGNGFNPVVYTFLRDKSQCGFYDVRFTGGLRTYGNDVSSLITQLGLKEPEESPKHFIA